MTDPSLSQSRTAIQKAIEDVAHIRGEDTPFVVGDGVLRTTGWIFDLRNVILQADLLEHAATLFWEKFKNEEVQIGTIETAGIPILTGFLAHGKRMAEKSTSGFYIRKSRKKKGLLKMVEGVIDPKKKIVLVDDVINSGNSFMRQVEVVESLGHRVHAIWTFIRYRDPAYYAYFAEKGIPIHALFELDDFKDTLGTENLKEVVTSPPRQGFRVLWKFVSGGAGYHHVVPKSDPILDAQKVYFGSDAGVFWAIWKHDGSVAWSRRVGAHPKQKGIFSSPALHKSIIYFGAYDGNVYALHTSDGKNKWVSFEADWVGSSPALAPDLGLLFIGLEYGLWKRRGGISALDMETGKRVWSFDMPCYTHSSPLYIPEHEQVVIGSNDGAIYLFDASSGALVWKYETDQLHKNELNAGFSRMDIKESCAYDSERDRIVCATMNGTVFSLERKTGKECHRFQAEAGFYTTPVLYENNVYVSSLDKNLYCIDMDTFAERWRWNASARIFATPVIIGTSLYIGANSGRLTELDPLMGSVRAFFATTERITNKVAFDSTTGVFFLPTQANELYCLEKISA